MRYLVSAEEMREYDSNTIEKIGIPACVLMERAALAAADRIEEYSVTVIEMLDFVFDHDEY